MSRCQGQGHVSSVGPSHNTSALGIDPRVFLQAFENLNMVENVLSAPVLVDPLHVTHPRSGACSSIRHIHRKSIKSQESYRRHREVGNMYPFLFPPMPMNRVYNRF